MTIIHKTFEIKSLVTRKDGGRILINTASVDRDRDRVMPAGARVDNYMRNPVVQWGHDYHSPWATIGKTTKLEVSPDGITADFDLRPTANEQDPQHIIRLLWEGGWVRTASIGFMPAKAKPNDVGGNDFEEWELLEWSLVPVPSNQDALRLAAKALDETQVETPTELSEPSNKEEEKGRKQTMREHMAGAMAALDECREHLSEMSDMMPEEEGERGKTIEQKRGRVLSAKNEQRLRAARDALDEVLVQLDEAPEVDEGKSKSETPKPEVPAPIAEDELSRLFHLDANGERDLADSLRTLLTNLKEVIT